MDDPAASSNGEIPDGEDLRDNELELGDITADLQLVQKDSMLAAIQLRISYMEKTYRPTLCQKRVLKTLS